VIRFEKGVVYPKSSTINAIQRALEEAGIEFLSLRGRDEGVRLRRNGRVPDR
jgi:hypothetical protein